MNISSEQRIDTTNSLNMNNLSDPNFWVSVSDQETQTVPLVVILPSGRHIDASSGHLALISNALYTHEVIHEIDKLSRLGGLNGITIQSMLDIDYYEIYMETKNDPNAKEWSQPTSPINSNILLLATADINVMTEILLNQCNSIETYGVGYAHPYDSCRIISGRGQSYTDRVSPNIGILSLYTVPWARINRLSMFCGGIMATGTLAATVLLLRYLRNQENANNKYRANIPLKIVNAEFKIYKHSELIDPLMCIPQHKLQNIDSVVHIIE